MRSRSAVANPAEERGEDGVPAAVAAEIHDEGLLVAVRLVPGFALVEDDLDVLLREGGEPEHRDLVAEVLQRRPIVGLARELVHLGEALLEPRLGDGRERDPRGAAVDRRELSPQRRRGDPARAGEILAVEAVRRARLLRGVLRVERDRAALPVAGRVALAPGRLGQAVDARSRSEARAQRDRRVVVELEALEAPHGLERLRDRQPPRALRAELPPPVGEPCVPVPAALRRAIPAAVGAAHHGLERVEVGAQRGRVDDARGLPREPAARDDEQSAPERRRVGLLQHHAARRRLEPERVEPLPLPDARRLRDGVVRRRHDGRLGLALHEPRRGHVEGVLAGGHDHVGIEADLVEDPVVRRLEVPGRDPHLDAAVRQDEAPHLAGAHVAARALAEDPGARVPAQRHERALAARRAVRVDEHGDRAVEGVGAGRGGRRRLLHPLLFGLVRGHPERARGLCVALGGPRRERAVRAARAAVDAVEEERAGLGRGAIADAGEAEGRPRVEERAREVHPAGVVPAAVATEIDDDAVRVANLVHHEVVVAPRRILVRREVVDGEDAEARVADREEVDSPGARLLRGRVGRAHARLAPRRLEPRAANRARSTVPDPSPGDQVRVGELPEGVADGVAERRDLPRRGAQGLEPRAHRLPRGLGDDAAAAVTPVERVREEVEIGGEGRGLDDAVGRPGRGLRLLREVAVRSRRGRRRGRGRGRRRLCGAAAQGEGGGEEGDGETHRREDSPSAQVQRAATRSIDFHR